MRPVCKTEGCNNLTEKRESKKNGVYYRGFCRSCRRKKPRTGKEYQVHRKDHCERCGFVPEHPCQLDVDHKDGEHTNNAPENLQTLCANCHRLKTHEERDYTK
ncbi:HNH endonuclease [Vibrio virus vB_VspP_SBP1]|uniref:HNH endonuclease n=1 Tax=Vibrio virus vB_VspP_SBP1 TaxID=2500581 RepID=A0A3T0IID1_9CAUD|nr:HNH endonuclease [Vibrio virus vB_VspP_SBP1]AZU99595.1 HNH endonuclease [Vibrio virus vB_VspP_SBP1]